MARNRFNRKSSSGGKLGIVIAPSIFICVLLMFFSGISSVSSGTKEHGRENLEKTIRQKAIHCYAVEGFYPPSLSYLADHYGLTYDDDTYLVDYRPIAENLMPDITVLTLDP